jgi:ABC-type sugar transport system ATPase subunit
MITDEIQEVLENANRALVMKDGRIIKELDIADANEETLKELLR